MTHGPGRPRIGERIHVVIPTDMLGYIDDNARTIGLPRAEMIRRLLQVGMDNLTINGPSDADRKTPSTTNRATGKRGKPSRQQWYIRVAYDGTLHVEPCPFLDATQSRMTSTLFDTEAEAEAALQQRVNSHHTFSPTFSPPGSWSGGQPSL